MSRSFEKATPEFLLELYKAHVVEEIRADLMKQLRPAVAEAAKTAADAMLVLLQKHYDVASDKVLLKIDVKTGG